MAGSRRAARLPRSRLPIPSRGRTNSGADGRGRLWPGATNGARTKPWEYFIPPPARAAGTARSAACGIGNAPTRPTSPARARPDTTPPTAPRTPGYATIAGSTPSGIRRMWLPRGMRPMPPDIRAFGMPRPAERGRRCGKRADSAWETPKNAAGPISCTAYRPLRPDRPSGGDAHRSPASPIRRSGYPTPKLEAHTKIRNKPVMAHKGNSRSSAHPLETTAAGR